MCTHGEQNQGKKKYQHPSNDNLSAHQKLSSWKLKNYIFFWSLEKLWFMPIGGEVTPSCQSMYMFYVYKQLSL